MIWPFKRTVPVEPWRFAQDAQGELRRDRGGRLVVMALFSDGHVRHRGISQEGVFLYRATCNDDCPVCVEKRVARRTEMFKQNNVDLTEMMP